MCPAGRVENKSGVLENPSADGAQTGPMAAMLQRYLAILRPRLRKLPLRPIVQTTIGRCALRRAIATGGA